MWGDVKKKSTKAIMGFGVLGVAMGNGSAIRSQEAVGIGCSGEGEILCGAHGKNRFLGHTLEKKKKTLNSQYA